MKLIIVTLLIVTLLSVSTLSSNLPFTPPPVYRDARAIGFAYLPGSAAGELVEYNFQQIVDTEGQMIAQFMSPVSSPGLFVYALNNYKEGVSTQLTVTGNATACKHGVVKSNPFKEDPYTDATFGGYQVQNGRLVAIIENVYAGVDPLRVTLDAFTHDLVGGFHTDSGVHVNVTTYVLGKQDTSLFQVPKGIQCNSKFVSNASPVTKLVL